MRGLSSPVPPAGSVPPIPRRRQPPPTHCGASRRNGRDLIIATRPAHQPLPSLHQRQRRKRYKRSPEPTTSPAAPIPRSQHRQICTYPPRAKGSLNRRFEWFSLVTFFLQKKKVTRAGARNSPSRARRRNTCSPPGRRSTHPPPAGKKTHKKTASRRPFSCLEPCPWRRARRRQLKRHDLSRLRVPERHACRPQRDRRVRLRRVSIPPVAHQRHPP